MARAYIKLGVARMLHHNNARRSPDVVPFAGGCIITRAGTTTGNVIRNVRVENTENFYMRKDAPVICGLGHLFICKI